LFRSEIVFRTTQEIEYLFFIPEFNIMLYDKNSESDYCFFAPPKSEYFFQQHWESEYFFRKKPYSFAKQNLLHTEYFIPVCYKDNKKKQI
jgi:hypothetical protein